MEGLTVAKRILLSLGFALIVAGLVRSCTPPSPPPPAAADERPAWDLEDVPGVLPKNLKYAT